MSSDSSRFVKHQLVISILTLLLTPAFTALIVYWQLSLTQSYWQKQYDIQRMTQLQGRRLQLASELY